MAYVDLNPVRAGIAATPEASDYTSIQARIADVNGSADAEVPSGEQATASPAPCAALEGETLRPEDEAQALPKVPLMPFDATARTPWAVPFAFEDYLELVDWTGRALRADKRGHIEGGDAEPPGSSTIVGAKRGSCVLRRTQDPIFQLALSIASIRYPLRSTQPLSIGSTGFPVSDHDYRVREQSRYFRY
jgi:hypothetical protein